MAEPKTPTPAAPAEPQPPQPRSPMHVPDEINELVRRKPPVPDDDRQRTDI